MQQQGPDFTFIAHGPGGQRAGDQVGECQPGLHSGQGGIALGHQPAVAGDGPVVRLLDARVVDDLQDVGEAEQGREEAVGSGTHPVLHLQVDPEDVGRLDDQVDGYEEGDVQEELPLHRAKRLYFRMQ